MQKTMSGGRKVGFTTALGATIVDTTYSVIAMFAVSLIDEFIMANQNMILIVGGVIVAFVGVGMVFKKIDMGSEGSMSVGNTLQAVCCALANPGAIAAMLALVTVFKIDVSAVPLWLLAPCVALGSMTYWQAFTAVFSRVRRSISAKNLQRFNMIAGIVVILLGIALALKGLVNL